MVTKTRAERLRSAIILFRFETDLIFGKMVAAWRFAKGNHHSRPRRDKLIRGAKGNKVKNQLKAKKSPSHGSIIDIDQQEVPIVARAPHEEGQDWEAMSVDDLWRLHESIVKVIAWKIGSVYSVPRRLLANASTRNHPAPGSHESLIDGPIRRSSLNIEITQTHR
jgi:hypothetical protein